MEDERARRNAEIEAIKQEMLAGMKKKKEGAKKDESSSSSDSSSSESSSSSDSEDEEEPRDIVWREEKLPFHFPIVRSGQHFKAVASLAVDRNGTRLVTGSIDGTVLVWDTARIHAEMRPFRSLATTSSLTGGATDQAVTSIAFNLTSALFAVGRSDPQVRMYDRDGMNGSGTPGEAKLTTTRGDPYIRDMSKTKGHVGGVSGVAWSTIKPEILFTSGSLDGTIRIWDVESGPKALMGLELACVSILKTPSKAGARTSVQALARSNDSKRLAAGCTGTTVHVWDVRQGGVFSAAPDKSFVCSQSVNDFVSLAFDGTDTYLAVAQRDAYEVRDVRKMDSPIWSRDKLGSAVKTINVHKNLIMVGCSNQIVLHEMASSRQIFKEEDAGLSSNLIWQNEKLYRGKTDGSVVVSFDEETGRVTLDSARTGATGMEQRKKSLKRVDESTSFARIDQERLPHESEGVVMPAHEALKMVKGTKRAKNSEAPDLRDQL